jgi:uroporphyrinogen decarboxylase
LRATLAGQPVDRLPVSTWGHDFLREWTAEDLAGHTIERQRKFDYDFVKLNPRWTMFAEPWGNRYQPPTEQKFPRLTHKVVNNPSDLASIPEVDVHHPVLQEYEQALGLVLEGIGDEVDVIVTLFSPLAVVGLLCGGVGKPLVGFAESHPALVHQALESATGTLLSQTSQLLARGAAGLFYAPLQWTSCDVCSPDFYAEYGKPYDLRVLEAAGAAEFNMLHICGNNISIDRYLDYPVHALNWDSFGPGNPGLADVHARTDRVVAGGIPHRQLHELEPDELQQTAERELGSLRRRVILAGGCAVGATIDAATRLEVAKIASRLR